MEDELTISDLADVLAALFEVTKPYQLGIQLKIDTSELDTIERNHPKDIDRQKTEVIKYWLRNSPDPSWTTLASALERMGGYAMLGKTLREKGQNTEEDSSISQVILPARPPLSHQKSLYILPSPHTRTQSQPLSCLNKCVQCNVLLLGKMGQGKSTLGNRMLDVDGWFNVNDQRCPQTSEGSTVIKSASQHKDYIFKIYDHNGLFEGASSIDTLSSDLPN